MRRSRPFASRIFVVAAVVLAGCTAAPERVPYRETVVALTASQQLIRFKAGEPGNVLSSQPVTGLQPGERLLGIDYRVAKGWLYAVGSTDRLYRLDPTTGRATPVGERFAVPLTGTHFGVDFNPTVDRLRVVSNTGQSMRIHPDTGAVVDSDAALPGVQVDGPLDHAPTDASARQRPAVVAVAYTYHPTDDKRTTNFAIDSAAGTLVTMGTRDGVSPAISPNSGHLFTVGSLRTGAFTDAAFDIADVTGTAFIAVTSEGAKVSRWMHVDLSTGLAHEIGSIGVGETVAGMTLEP